MKRTQAASVLALLMVLTSPLLAQTPIVVSTTPGQNALNVSKTANISVVFDIDMDAATINSSSFIVLSLETGLCSGAINYDAPSRTAVFDPDTDYRVGDNITVRLTTAIQSSGGIPLDNEYEWSFIVTADGGSGYFATPPEYSTGIAVQWMCAADFDRDGDLDIATANYSGHPTDPDSTVSILTNDGNGTFALAATYLAGLNPDCICTADFNADGYPDLAMCTFSHTLVVFINNGDGTFADGVIYSLGVLPLALCAVDIDGDGVSDIVVAGRGGEYIFLNDGEGAFTYEDDLGEAGYRVKSADFNSDGHPDLAFLCLDSVNLVVYLQIALNDGAGNFTSVYSDAFAFYSWDLDVGDIDGDGDIDVVAGNYMGNSIMIFRNAGDGEMGEPTVLDLGLNAPIHCELADYDDDGDLDLAVTNQIPKSGGAPNPGIYLNNGDGEFSAGWVYYHYADNPGIVSGDMDNDGDIDLAVTIEDYPSGSSLWIYLNRPYQCVDSDGDGFGDPGYPDNTCPDDNCPEVYNPGQFDWDGDGVGDACQYICGDVNVDGTVNIADVVELVNIIFIYADELGPQCRCDANGDASVNIGDAVYLINYIFKGGPPPPGQCCP